MMSYSSKSCFEHQLLAQKQLQDCSGFSRGVPVESSPKMRFSMHVAWSVCHLMGMMLYFVAACASLGTAVTKSVAFLLPSTIKHLRWHQQLMFDPFILNDDLGK